MLFCDSIARFLTVYLVKQYAIPFLVSLYDYWRNQRSQPKEDYVPLQRFQGLPIQLAYSTCRRSFHFLSRSRGRGIIAAAFISVAGYMAASFTAGSQSTYVCPIVINAAARLQIIRVINTLVDSVLLIGVADLCRTGADHEGKRRKRALVSLGAGLLVSGDIEDSLARISNGDLRALLSSGVLFQISLRTVVLNTAASPSWM